MRAVAVFRFGGPEVLSTVDLPEPIPGAGEIRIRVAAATVNPTDTWLRAGRNAKALLNIPPPWIPGMELAGEVDAVGPGTAWTVGERVMAVVLPLRPGGGAQAERVVVQASSVARVPDGVSLFEAATLPLNGLTARLALDLLDLRPGQTLAVTGAAGALGGYAVELAKIEGLHVLADAAPADEGLVRRLGADTVVPRGETTAHAIREARPQGVDAVIDAALLGQAILPAIRDGGQLAAVRRFGGDTERQIMLRQVWITEYLSNSDALDRLGRLAAAGRLTMRIDETYPPERAAEAHRRLEAGGVRGRMLIVF